LTRSASWWQNQRRRRRTRPWQRGLSA
jgi:hypothetical protein